MRQYSPWRRIIATKVWGLILAGALAGVPAQAQTELPDYQWYRKAAAAAMQQQMQQPVLLESFAADGSLLSADLQVQPWYKENSVDIVLAVPPGEITSGSLTISALAGDEATTTALSDDEDLTASAQAAIRDIPVSVRHLGYIRGNRLVKVRFSTSVPGSFGEKLKEGRLDLAYAAGDALASVGTKADARPHGPVDAMLRQLVANPADLERFAVPLGSVPQPVDGGDVPNGGYADAIAKFESTDDGFVEFTGADLAAAGVDIDSVNANNVTVWSGEKQQPVLNSAFADGDRPIKAGDSFMVYARDNESTYTVTRDYWVRMLDGAAMPMDFTIAPPADPETVDPDAHFWADHVVEKDVPPVLTKNDQFLTILGYRWVWWTWTPAPVADAAVPNPRGYDTSGSLRFDLSGLAQSVQNYAPLTLHFYSHYWPQGSGPVTFRVELNGRSIGDVAVAEPSGLKHILQVPTSALRATSNTLVLMPETAQQADLPELCFDRMEISYPRTYEMTSSVLAFSPPTTTGGNVAIRLGDSGSTRAMIANISGDSPRIISIKGGPVNGTYYLKTEGPETNRYLAITPDAIRNVSLEPVRYEVDLKSPENQADLVVIAWPEFMEDLKPWVADKTLKGHVIKVVSIFDIYDQFGYGHESPHAIRAFLRHASVNWQGSDKGPAASAVLLVGDSTSAYRDEFRNDVINYVPTMRLQMGGDAFASDQWYVMLFGDDPFTDALIGRFSVNSQEDLRALIQKQLDYENASKPGPWQNTLGFVADHSEFEETVDRIMNQVVPPRFFLDRIMMSELPWVDNYYFPKEIADAREAKVSPEATSRIRDMFNEGAAVVTYFGHGSPNIWSNERMWFGGDSPNSDNLLLTNRDMLSIVINMTCNSGAIDYPQPRWNVCISEDFMRVPNGGAVACFVPSGPGLTVQHERLMMEVGRILFDGDPHPLGQGLQLALWRYLAAGNPTELARMYIMLGDPLLMPDIAQPFDSDTAKEAGAVQWPGTIALPPDVAAEHQGGSFQIKEYGESISSGDIGRFTSTTRALTVPPSSGDEARVIAFANAEQDQASTAIESTFAPISALEAVTAVQWRRIDGADEDATATIEFRLRNSTPVPVRQVQVQVVSDQTGQLHGVSAPVDFYPFEEQSVRIDVATKPGFSMYRVFVAGDKKRLEIETGIPVGAVGLRPDNMRQTLPPATVDPRSITTRYRTSGDEVVATVSAQIYTLATEALSNLRIGLEDPNGLVIQDSIVTVPAVEPGEGVRVSLSVKLPAGTESQVYSFRFDPSGFYPEFARFPAQTVKLGNRHFADVLIASVTPTEPSPTDGETVFFDVTVANQGDALADGVHVEGLRLTTSTESVELKSQVALPEELLSLEPGSTETVRLRWDPFRNAGQNRLSFIASSTYQMPDSAPNNNSQKLTMDVRTKARVRRIKVGVLPVTPDDKQQRQVRFMARVHNEGESDAHGLMVRFYSSAETTAENYLGEAELLSLKAGETKDVIFTYKLKPEEIHRKFNITFEVVYKGSRQRVSVD